MQITTRPLTPHFGAEVIGVDLDQVEDEGVRRRLEHLWWKHQVLLFRGLDTADEKRLTGLSKVFGRLEIHSRTEYLSPTVPELLYVSNMKEGNRSIGVLGDGEADWHTDQVYRPTPALGSLLAAAIVPPEGGNTSFADMYRAYETLPEKTKKRIDGLKALCSYEYFNQQYSEPANDGQRKAGTEQIHPVVRTHPITGRKALYVARSVTPYILDIPKEESDELLAELDAQCRRPEFIYEHKWEVGDGVLWDNACVKHRRDTWDPVYPRLMKRTTIRPPESLGVPF
ncbi:MAG: TauD/TfdA dioxygenase family protein [Alphaproteobacteria bacterium]